MKTYKTIQEVLADVIDGVLKIDDDITFECNVSGDFNIKARNIDARDIEAYDIKAYNIKALNIKAGDIKARNIEALNIDAGDIEYFAICFAYQNIHCKTIKSTRPNAKHFVLDGELITGKS